MLVTQNLTIFGSFFGHKKCSFLAIFGSLFGPLFDRNSAFLGTEWAPEVTKKGVIFGTPKGSRDPDPMGSRTPWDDPIVLVLQAMSLGTPCMLMGS